MTRELTRLQRLALAKPAEYFAAVWSMESADGNFKRISTFWVVDACNEVLGETFLRHTLTLGQEAESGHVGYVVRPSARAHGCAKAALALVLEAARASGFPEVRLACDADNLASAAVILANHGELVGESRSLLSGRRVLQFRRGLSNDSQGWGARLCS